MNSTAHVHIRTAAIAIGGLALLSLPIVLVVTR